jgi:hypothetical protein
MTFTTPELEEFAVAFPIVQAARETADAFASKQPTPEKAEQVRLNTLAVWVMNDYLQMMGVQTNLTGSDSWNPVMRLWSDVADLALPGIGRLECRPVIDTTANCPIPPEVWEDRIGYMVIQFDRVLEEAKILGFTPTANVEALPLTQLQSPEDLFDHLFELQQAAQAVSAPAALRSTLQPVARPATQVSLSQWFAGVIDAGWQAVDALLAPQLNPAFEFRTRGLEQSESNAEGRIQRAKTINLGIQLAEQPVALLVEIQPALSPEINILLQVHPTGDRQFLPPDLFLRVLDESGAVFREAQSRVADNYIQLQLSGQPGEAFSVQVAIGDASVTESFVI